MERFIHLGDKERRASCTQLWWLVCAADSVDPHYADTLVRDVLVHEGLLLAR